MNVKVTVWMKDGGVVKIGSRPISRQAIHYVMTGRTPLGRKA